MTYDSTSGSSFQSTMFGASTQRTPTVKSVNLPNGATRQITCATGNIDQMMATAGFVPEEVNMKELMRSGVDLGLPKVDD